MPGGSIQPDGAAMKLRRLTDYALRVLIHVAEHPDRRCTVPEIAAAHGISEHHLVKIVHQLGRLGYLDTVRGRGGGVRLRGLPESVDLAQVIRTFEQDDGAIADCATCRVAANCRLSGVLHRAMEAFYADLARQTLADIIRPAAVPIPARRTASSSPSPS